MTLIASRINGYLFFLIVLTSVTACSVLSDSSEQEESIQTDRNSYSAKLDHVQNENRSVYEFEIIARLKNPTDEMILIPYLSQPCDLPLFGVRSLPPSRKLGSALRQVWEGSNSEHPCLEEFTSLGPGTSRIDTIKIGGPFAWESGTNNF